MAPLTDDGDSDRGSPRHVASSFLRASRAAYATAHAETAERHAALERSLAESTAQLEQAREELASLSTSKASLEGELRAAIEASRASAEATSAVEGARAQLSEARTEIDRLRKLQSASAAAGALHHAERDKEIERARAAGRAEGEAASREAAAATVGEMRLRLKADATSFDALYCDLTSAESERRVAEAAAERAEARVEALAASVHERAAALEASYEAKLAALTAALEAAADGERHARFRLDDMRQTQAETLVKLRSAHQQIASLREHGASSHAPSFRRPAAQMAPAQPRAEAEQPLAPVEPPAHGRVPPQPPTPVAGSTSLAGPAPPTATEADAPTGGAANAATQLTAGVDAPPPPASGAAAAADAGGLGGGFVAALEVADHGLFTADGDGAYTRPHSPPAAHAMPPPPAHTEPWPPDQRASLLLRTQRQLLEVAALTDLEHQLLLGEPPAHPMHASIQPNAPPPRVIVDGVEIGGGGAGGGAGGGGGGVGGSARGSAGGKIVAGSGSRIAWLLREGIGHTDSLGIRSAVRPNTRPLEPAQLRRVLRSLFAQQRALSSQSALGNWELLGSMALLRPRQLQLNAVLDIMVAEMGETTSERRRTELSMQMPRVSTLAAQREQQRRWCCGVWEVRRQAVAAVTSRLTNQALYSLTKLTDAANTQPVVRPAPRTPSTARPYSKRDVLAASIFGAPPVLPFAALAAPGSARDAPVGRPTARDWAEWAAGSSASGAPLSVWGGGASGRVHGGASGGLNGGAYGGLTTEQMQRLCVAAHHWPQDFASLGARLQRQMLAEAVQYCLTGATQPAQSTPFAIDVVHDVDSGLLAQRAAPVATNTRPRTAPGTDRARRTALPPSERPPSSRDPRSTARQAGQPLVLQPRTAAEAPRASLKVTP